MSAGEKAVGSDYAPSPDLLALVAAEMRRQRVKWGEQNHPDIHLPTIPHSPWSAHTRELHASLRVGVPTEQTAKVSYESAVKYGVLDWGLILVEEVAEAVAAAARGDTGALKTELVQVAAVCLSWVEAIGRRAP